jgi:hypothetical protein
VRLDINKEKLITGKDHVEKRSPYPSMDSMEGETGMLTAGFAGANQSLQLQQGIGR